MSGFGVCAHVLQRHRRADTVRSGWSGALGKDGINGIFAHIGAKVLWSRSAQRGADFLRNLEMALDKGYAITGGEVNPGPTPGPTLLREEYGHRRGRRLLGPAGTIGKRPRTWDQSIRARCGFVERHALGH